MATTSLEEATVSRSPPPGWASAQCRPTTCRPSPSPRAAIISGYSLVWRVRITKGTPYSDVASVQDVAIGIGGNTFNLRETITQCARAVVGRTGRVVQSNAQNPAVQIVFRDGRRSRARRAFEPQWWSVYGPRPCFDCWRCVVECDLSSVNGQRVSLDCPRIRGRWWQKDVGTGSNDRPISGWSSRIRLGSGAVGHADATSDSASAISVAGTIWQTSLNTGLARSASAFDLLASRADGPHGNHRRGGVSSRVVRRERRPPASGEQDQGKRAHGGS